MSSFFFVDFTAFLFLGVITGLDWMIAFSIATFLALATSRVQSRLTHRPAPVRVRRARGDLRALPAFRDGRRQRDRDGRD